MYMSKFLSLINDKLNDVYMYVCNDDNDKPNIIYM